MVPEALGAYQDGRHHLVGNNTMIHRHGQEDYALSIRVIT